MLAGACSVPPRLHLSTLTPYGRREESVRELVTMSKYANFASSLPMSGEETVESILMSFTSRGKSRGWSRMG